MIALRTINKEIEDFKNKQINIVPGFTFNQNDTVQQIFFYHNSRFTSGQTDDEGDRKYFYNINRNPCKVYTKAIDFDTKNIRLLTAGGGDPLKTWFIERDLRYWMRKQQFGKVLNRIFKELPIYGSVVIKIVDGKPYFVDLRNFIVEQGADNLDSSAFIIEIHRYTPGEFRTIGKQMKWDSKKVEEVIDLYHQMKDTSHIRLYERYGEVMKESEDGNRTWSFQRTFIADVGVDEFDNYGRKTVEHTGVLLASEDWEQHPYWEFHKDKIPGRWLGVGVVEELFEPQIKQNEIVNLQSKGAAWKAIMLFQTRDQAFNRNLAVDARNGEVLNTDSEVTQINMEDRNLSFFNEETRKWMNNRDELTFAYDSIQGERSPAGTPLGSTQISIGQTLSYFEGVQEEIALDIKEMLYKVIIPQFEKENTQEHILRLVGRDLEQYMEMIKNDLIAKETIRLISGGAFFPTTEKLKAVEIAIEEALKMQKELNVTIPKGFYSGIKYDVDIDITGESVDTRVRYATRFAILQAMTADPTMTTDPTKRKILMGMAEDGGLNPADFLEPMPRNMESGVPAEMRPMTGRAGGGVSAPALDQALQGNQQMTV